MKTSHQEEMEKAALSKPSEDESLIQLNFRVPKSIAHLVKMHVLSCETTVQSVMSIFVEELLADKHGEITDKARL